MRHARIGVGEGWRFVGVTIGTAPVDPDRLDEAGFDTFVNPCGRVYARDPNLASAFQPRAAQAREMQR